LLSRFNDCDDDHDSIAPIGQDAGPDPVTLCSARCEFCGLRYLDHACNIRCALCQCVFHRDDISKARSKWSCQDQQAKNALPEIDCEDFYKNYHRILAGLPADDGHVYQKDLVDKALCVAVRRIIADGCIDQICSWSGCCR